MNASGTSLEDHLLTGPTLQSKLFDVILKFRLHRNRIAFCADIQEMYRQIFIHSVDRKYQRILWRPDPIELIHHYELNTVTYGINPASYLAIKCLQVIAQSVHASYRKAALAINLNFYMDDLTSGDDSLDEALKLQRRFMMLLSTVDFKLRKYQSNSVNFLKCINLSLIETLNTRFLGAQAYIFVLGLIWCPRQV